MRCLLVLSNLAMLIAAGVVHAQNAPSHGAAVTEEGIAVSVTVYVTSLIAVAVSTWTVAKYDAARIRKIERLEQKMNEISKHILNDRDP